MAWKIFIVILLGMATGRYVLAESFLDQLDTVITTALALMILVVGIDIGQNRQVLKDIRQMGVRILIVPLAVCGGTLIGSAMAAVLLAMPLKESLAVGAGFGWYSLSGVLIAQIYNVELGTTAFLANVFRELMAFIMIPFLAVRLGRIPAIAPGGATTMDSTLPLITQVTDRRTGLIAFTSGLSLTALVPVLIPFLLA